MNTYLKKFKGQNQQLVPKSTVSEIIFAFIGSFIAIGIIGYCTKTYDNLLMGIDLQRDFFSNNI
ncbi:hypothetical protein L5F35_12160 [Aliarcobacter butzleri]|uniref:hypothetical protein n=1 Tax=Aliarcobacter butzleri TaxID=28197 RepID=UPI001EDADE33|nr:hypothetical protein [Aliarcobacter butzleri]MCG3686968.1 hypothetical protein [Aliarcobacter butzleri]